MSGCLRNSRSLLSRVLLRPCSKPLHPPVTPSQYHRHIHTDPPRPSYHRPFLSPPLPPASNLWGQPSARRWYCNLPDVGSDVLWNQEIVPYTNRVHRVFALLNECELVVDDIKKMHGDNILGPSHPATVRIRRITDDIIRGIHGVLLTKSPCENGDGHSSLKEDDSGPVPNGSQGKATMSQQPHTGHLRELKWEVFTVRNKRVRAYIKRGGKIVIYTGLLDSFNIDAEIATILAHEIGHEVARHVLEPIKIIEFFTPLLAKLLPFSRRKEIEADHIGIMLLAAAGFDPRVAPGVYEKLGEINGDSPWKDYFGSHPSWKTRSRILSQRKVMEEALELYHRQVCTNEMPRLKF